MSLARDIGTVGSGTLISRLLGFARDAVIAALLGVGPLSEAFFAVMQIINVFRRLLAEGAFNSAFVPIWLRLRAERGEASAHGFTRRSLLVMFCIAGLVTLAIATFSDAFIAVVAPGFPDEQREFAALLLTITAPYVLFAGLAAVFAAALNAERRVAAAAIAAALFNGVLVAVVTVLFLARIDPFAGTLALAGAIGAAAALQLAFIAAAWLAAGRRRPGNVARAPAVVRMFFARALPGLMSAGLPQLKLIAVTAVVSSSAPAVAWLYYANRLYGLPLGVVSVAAAAAVVPRMAASLHAGQGADVAGAQSRALELSLGLALPAAAGLGLLAAPVCAVLFERGAFTASDTAAVATALIGMSGGLPAHALEKVFAAASFAREDTATPMMTALFGLLGAAGAALMLFPRYGLAGAAAAIAVSAWASAALLGALLARRGWLRIDGTIRRRLPRIALAVASMVATLAAARVVMPEAETMATRILALAALVALGVLSYAAALHILGVARLGEIIAAIKSEA
jgi:putative peptidoglycan lipid II flippase